MQSLNTFDQLRYLDRSSSEFHDQLSEILCGEEYERWVSNLDCDDLVWLVGYLDKVCGCIALLHSPLKLDRPLIASIPQVPVPGNVYMSFGAYVAPR